MSWREILNSKLPRKHTQNTQNPVNLGKTPHSEDIEHGFLEYRNPQTPAEIPPGIVADTVDLDPVVAELAAPLLSHPSRSQLPENHPQNPINSTEADALESARYAELDRQRNERDRLAGRGYDYERPPEPCGVCHGKCKWCSTPGILICGACFIIWRHRDGSITKTPRPHFLENRPRKVRRRTWSQFPQGTKEES